jgi:hypothetical protein
MIITSKTYYGRIANGKWQTKDLDLPKKKMSTESIINREGLTRD